MDDSSASTAPWLLLLHHLPPKPDYFRVRVRRRLQQLGAIPLKNAVYVLPNNEASVEDFHWLAEEIRRDGGQVIVAEARFLLGVSDRDLIEQFNAQQAESYRELVAEARQALVLEPAQAGVLVAELERRLGEVAERDAFGAAERALAESAIDEVRRQIVAVTNVASSGDRPAGSVWVTRQNVFVDRIASAWLIRRFIDREARFKFVPAIGYLPATGEYRYDMFEGEYGHEGDRCTFETLVDRFALTGDVGLAAIAEIVHDLDLKDAKFGRAEAAGVLALLQGIVSRYAADAERVEHGRRLFDQLYSHLSRAAEG
jgi:hypothetical protein